MRWYFTITSLLSFAYAVSASTHEKNGKVLTPLKAYFVFCKGSYIPNRDQRELKELVRYRRSLIEECSCELNRLQMILEGANIKLSSVVSDIDGVSSRMMLESLIKGAVDVNVLSRLAKGRMKNKTEELKKALTGMVGLHQRMIIAEMLKHIVSLKESIQRLDTEVKERMRPFEAEVASLESIVGVGERSAQTDRHGYECVCYGRSPRIQKTKSS